MLGCAGGLPQSACTAAASWMVRSGHPRRPCKRRVKLARGVRLDLAHEIQYLQ